MFIKFCVITVCFCAFISCSGQKQIQGKWISENPEQTATGSFGMREFSIGKESWEVRYTVYLDSTLQRPVFTFRGIGKYNISKPSVKVNNAEEAVFSFDKKYVTLKVNDPAIIRKFGMHQCNLPYNVEKDITEAGCGYLASKAVCSQEYDLVRRSGDKLFMGARPASGGMCEESKRPKGLGSPLKKIND